MVGVGVEISQEDRGLRVASGWRGPSGLALRTPGRFLS